MELDIRTNYDEGHTMYINKSGAAVTEHANADIIEINLAPILERIPLIHTAQRLRIHLEK